MNRRLTLAACAAIMLTLPAAMCKTTLVRGCVTKEQVEQLKQAEPSKVKDSLTGQADKDLTIVSGSAIRLRAWGKGLLQVVEGCAG